MSFSIGPFSVFSDGGQTVREGALSVVVTDTSSRFSSKPSTRRYRQSPRGFTQPRYFLHTATLLSSGKVLIAGGNGTGVPPGALSSAEMYDPITGTFSVTGSMSTARQFHTATLLSNGMVFIAGGWTGSVFLSSAELYDPANGTFTATASMATPRANHTATLLPNGKVLIVGGSSNG